MTVLRQSLFATGGAVLIAVFASVADTGRAQQPAPSAPSSTGTDAQRCAALLRDESLEMIPGAPTRITGARVVDVPGDAPALAGSPVKQFCHVTGYVAPQNKFELMLPLPAQWNQKFMLVPCAGFCGGIAREQCNPALARGYAAITGNGGHDSPFGFDGVWAANNPNLQEDFAWRHNHVITLAGKAITTRFYGRPIARAYMSGCSKGGHAGLMEAQRFPGDFDGIIAGAPVYDFVGRIIAAAWWTQAVNNGERGSVLTPAAVNAVTQSILARCGSQTGARDDVVSDPASCEWRPEQVACPATKADDACLSERQIAAVKKMMAPVADSRGRIVYPWADIPGTSTEWSGWHFGRGGNPATPRAFANYSIAEQFLRYMADPAAREGADPLTFNFDRDPATLERARKLYDATSFDLRAFKARGGKLLVWHGLADAAIVATSSVAYYEGVEKLMGGRAQTQDFFRVFLLPGMHHCFGGPGFAQFDELTLLENWVEKGQAPDVMIANRILNGVTQQRPIYPYPLRTRYTGQGDPAKAASYTSVDPSRR